MSLIAKDNRLAFCKITAVASGFVSYSALKIKMLIGLLLFFYELVTWRTKSPSIGSVQKVAFINKKEFYHYSYYLWSPFLKQANKQGERIMHSDILLWTSLCHWTNVNEIPQQKLASTCNCPAQFHCPDWQKHHNTVGNRSGSACCSVVIIQWGCYQFWRSQQWWLLVRALSTHLFTQFPVKWHPEHH